MAEQGDDRTLAILTFEIAALQRDLERVRAEIKELRSDMVRHDLWDVAQGSNRVDLGRLDNEVTGIEKALEAAKKVAESQHDRLAARIDTLKQEIESNFRKGVILVFTSILAPLIVGGIVVLFNVLGRVP